MKVAVVLAVVFGAATARSKSPLIDEGGAVGRNPAAECVFGKHVRELGSVWTPDLGPPIGILYCMKCECVPFQKKRRVVARVQCRNIKNECPEPTCDNPVVKPDRCCKLCDGDTKGPDVIQDIIPQNMSEDEEKSSKHYAALLTERSSLVLKNDFMRPPGENSNKNNVVATGRFSFSKKNLYYSFYISEKAARPHSLQFVDSEGNILEEFTLSYQGGYVNSVYQNATRKVCGIWRRLPRDYRRLLKQEKMYAVLIWGVKDQAEFTISGQLMKYVALGTELFSSLLEPAPGTNPLMMAGAGGTAIVSTSTLGPYINIANIAIIFNGLFTPDETHEVPIEITLSLDDKKQIIIQEIVRVLKPATHLNIVNISSNVSLSHLRLLTRGKLLLSVTSVSKPDALKLSGNVMTKVSCELFQTTLISNTSSRTSNLYGASGLAWLYLNNAGSLIYNIQIDNLPPEVSPVQITLTDNSNKKKTEVEDLTPSYINGWANGTIDKLSPRVLDPLYDGSLAVNVATGNETSVIKGKLIAKPVADARDSPAPILLKRENLTLPRSVVGIAWISVDNDCHIHYDVSINGIGNDKKLELFIDMYPLIAPGAPFINKHLEDFQGNQVEGSPIEALTKEELNWLDNGVSLLKVRDREENLILLTATITKVPIPPSCRLSYSSKDNNVLTFFDHPEVLPSGECFYEEKFYQEETSWVSPKNPCKMCFCQNGVAKCYYMTCPEIDCPNGRKENVDGECCPVCITNSTIRENVPKCIFNGRSYWPGSKFHPFLIPSGFDLCTECLCDPKYVEIKCNRLNENEQPCCRNCENKNISTSAAVEDPFSEDHVPYMEKKKTTSEADRIIAEGGCNNPHNPKKPYVNGTDFHPIFESLGEYKCVTCKCQNGKPKCRKQHCNYLTCKKMEEMRRNKIKILSSDFCCSFKECKKLLQKHKKKSRTTT